jgi:hypothetical protein
MSPINEHRPLIAVTFTLLLVLWLMNRVLNKQGRLLLLQRLRALDPAQREQLLVGFTPKVQVELRLGLQNPDPAARPNSSTHASVMRTGVKKWILGHPRLLYIALLPGMIVGMALGFHFAGELGVFVGATIGSMLAASGYANLRVWLLRSLDRFQ